MGRPGRADAEGTTGRPRRRRGLEPRATTAGQEPEQEPEPVLGRDEDEDEPASAPPPDGPVLPYWLYPD